MKQIGMVIIDVLVLIALALWALGRFAREVFRGPGAQQQPRTWHPKPRIGGHVDVRA